VVNIFRARKENTLLNMVLTIFETNKANKLELLRTITEKETNRDPKMYLKTNY